MSNTANAFRAVRIALLLLLSALPLVLCAAAIRPSIGTAAPAAILYPADKSIVTGPIRVIVSAGKDAPKPVALLDGKPLSLQRMAFAADWQLPGKIKATAEKIGDRRQASLWVAMVNPKPGGHTLSAGARKITLRAGTPAAGFARAYAHPLLSGKPGDLDCSACHTMTDGALGSVSTPKACSGCHDDTKVQLIHKHVLEPLARCAMCHDPHGATRAKLLVDDKKKLCSKCHEYGHSKE